MRSHNPSMFVSAGRCEYVGMAPRLTRRRIVSLSCQRFSHWFHQPANGTNPPAKNVQLTIVISHHFHKIPLQFTSLYFTSSSLLHFHLLPNGDQKWRRVLDPLGRDPCNKQWCLRSILVINRGRWRRRL